MESRADAERYHRYNEPDSEMDDGGCRTTQKPVYATHLRLSQYNIGLAFHTAYSCIFHPCNFARIAFSTPAFSVAPGEGRGILWRPPAYSLFE